MPARIPAHIREQQIDNLPNIRFVRWDGEYRNTLSKAVCRCTVDGFEWSASVGNLLSHGRGCPECAVQRRRTPSDERVKQINNLPSIKFVRWDGEYRNCLSKAVCRCGAGHEWSSTVNHLVSNGSGCPECAKSGYSQCKSGTLYALRSECGTMIKIGISNDYAARHTTLRRTTPFDWSCVEMIHGDGALIAGLEKALHGLTEPAVFKNSFDGYTEWRKWDNRIPEWFSNWREMI